MLTFRVSICFDLVIFNIFCCLLKNCVEFNTIILFLELSHLVFGKVSFIKKLCLTRYFFLFNYFYFKKKKWKALTHILVENLNNHNQFSELKYNNFPTVLTIMTSYMYLLYFLTGLNGYTLLKCIFNLKRLLMLFQSQSSLGKRT